MASPFTLVLTAVPRRIQAPRADGARRAELDLVVTFRFAPDDHGAPPPLASTWLANWPAQARQLSFLAIFEDRQQGIVQAKCELVQGSGDAKLNEPLWQELFPSAGVRTHEPTRDLAVPLRSYSRVAVGRYLDAYYSQQVRAHSQSAAGAEHWRQRLDAERAFEPLKWQRRPGEAGLFGGLASVPPDRLATVTPLVTGDLRPTEMNVSRIVERDLYRLADEPRVSLYEDVLHDVEAIHRDAQEHLSTLRRFRGDESAESLNADAPAFGGEVRRDFLRLQLLHARVPAPYAPRVRAAVSSSLDFLERLAHVRNYPSLLMPLGLVLRLECLLTGDVERLRRVRVSIATSPEGLRIPSIWTAFQMDEAGNARAADDAVHSPFIEQGYLNLKYRFASPDQPKFVLQGYDVDSAAAQLLLAARTDHACHGATLITDQNLTIASASAAAERMLGVARDSLPGRSLTEFFVIDRRFLTSRIDAEFDGVLNEPLLLLSGTEGRSVSVLPIRARGKNLGLYSWQLEPNCPAIHEREGAPAPRRTNGISLVAENRAADLADKKRRAAQLLTGEGSDAGVELNAPDLVFGYLVDVWSERGQRWFNLNRRSETFRFGQGGALSYPDVQSPLRAAAARATDRLESQASDGQGPIDESVAEELFQWTGWSLTVSSPFAEWAPYAGRATTEVRDDVRQTTLAPEFSLPSPGTLPALRFGDWYRFRVRLVDIAGGHAPFGQEERFASDVIQLARYEPLAPPAILVSEDFVPLGKLRSLERMVVDAALGADVRFLVPPRVSLELALLHGKLDKRSVPTGYEEAELNEDGSFPTLPSFEAGTADGPSGHSGAGLSGTTTEGLPVFRRARRGPPKFPYFPDPLAVTLAVDVWTFNGEALDSPVTLTLYGSRKWPDASHVELVLRKGDRFRASARAGRIEVELPAAYTATAEIRCLPAREHVFLLAEGRGLAPSALEQVAAAGHPLLSTPRTVHLVHAVKEPLAAPNWTYLALSEPATSADSSSRGSEGGHSKAFKTSARQFGAEFELDLKSTGHLEISAKWREPWDERSADATVPPRAADKGASVEHKVARWELPQAKAATSTRHSRTFHHDFADTKHRYVEFVATGYSRFQELFPSLPAQHFARESAPEGIHVLSTAPPAPVDLAYVVPLFGWNTQAGPRYTSERRGGGLRIYMHRGWFSSGQDELLGVVCWPVPSAATCKSLNDGRDLEGGPSTGELDKLLENRVTRWALDPLNDSRPFGEFPSLEQFKRANRYGCGLRFADLPDARVAVAGYEPRFNSERQLWYVDLVMRPLPGANAFIRLALVRYQPHALEEAKLSDVVLADFAQLLPDRSVTVARVAPSVLTITVNGHEPGRRRDDWSNRIRVRVDIRDGNGALGDFGWRADSDAEVTPASDSEPRGESGGLSELPELARFRVTFQHTTGKRRLVVTEHERFEGDALDSLGHGERLVYADVLDLG